MTDIDLFILVQRAKAGDKEAMNQIIVMFRPLIIKVSQRAKPNERSDLQQDIIEKVIRSVLSYDMNSLPDYTEYIEQIKL
ncbi:helix-turn-helix domain-containing protein [Paenibacillus sp. FA6]|uniref:helix-turn-helix domain-containing protein n=1 Tax=Paenibacillus sp. FA6 TaxID=3413029 RepID=UPI003F65F011